MTLILWQNINIMDIATKVMPKSTSCGFNTILLLVVVQLNVVAEVWLPFLGLPSFRAKVKLFLIESVGEELCS